MNLQTLTSVKDIIETAREAEAGQEPERAAELYEQVIKEDGVNEYAYDRLMILYRKSKQYKDEMRIINAGIKAHENFYKKESKHPRSRKVAEISNAFLNPHCSKNNDFHLFFWYFLLFKLHNPCW